MLTYIAHAEGSVSSSVIVDGSEFGSDPQEVIPYLRSLHESIDMSKHPHGLISKYVLVKRSDHPMYDLNYWFFQMVPGNPVTFDYTGSCGHSILAAIQVATKWGWLPASAPGSRVRVYVQNVGDSLVCEVDQASRERLICTAHFIEAPQTRLQKLLPSGSPVNRVSTSFGDIEISIVSCGNPYVFVDAADLGFESEAALFAAGDETLARLQEIRRAASGLLGWNPDSVFPKIAAVASFEQGSLTLRGISVPSWHPTIALTGAACVGAAASIKDTLVYRIVLESNSSTRQLKLRTKGGSTVVSTATTGPYPDDYLLYNSISEKHVQLIGPLPLKKGESSLWEQQEQPLQLPV